MTALTCHKERPFTYFSSHFDASIIQWSLHGIPDVGLAMVKFLLGCPKEDTLCDDIDSMMSSNTGQTKLAGVQSRALFEETKDMPFLDRSERILKFFLGLDGQEELWAMAHIVKGDGPGLDTEKLRVHHITDVAAAYSSKATGLLQANQMTLLGTALAKKEDRMQEAARL